MNKKSDSCPSIQEIIWDVRGMHLFEIVSNELMFQMTNEINDFFRYHKIDKMISMCIHGDMHIHIIFDDNTEWTIRY